MKLFNLEKSKIFVSLVCMLAVLSGISAPLLLLAPTPVHAQLSTFETNPVLLKGIAVTALSTAATAGTSANIAADSNIHTVTEQVLNGLAWTVAKVAVQSITRSIVNWINSGFKGSPAFATDLQANLQNVGDSVVNSFLAQVNQSAVNATGFNIKSPFQDQLSNQLRTAYYQQSANFGIPAYSLGQSSQNPTVFLNGNFSQGGFNAFLSASQNPQNNPFGAYLLAQNALFSQLNSAVDQRKTELGWGKGFLSFRSNCGPGSTSYSNINSSVASESSTLTGADLKSSGSTGNILTSGPNNIPGTSGYTGSQSILTNSTPTNTSLAASPSTVSLSQADGCVGKPVQTPGSVIENQLENSLGSGVRQLELANSINEIVGALASQLVSQVVGPNGLLSASSPSSGGGPSVVAQATDPSQYSTVTSSIADGFKQSVSNQRTSVVAYQNNEQTILNAATSASQACGTTTAAVYPEIQTAIASSTAGITKASSAIRAIDTITANITAAQNAPAASQTTAISAVVTQNQSLLSSSLIPTAQETTQATIDSTDTGTTTPPSLYSKLQQDAKVCSVGVTTTGV